MKETSMHKILRDTPDQGGKSPFPENYKRLLKGMKEDTNNWKYIPCSWTERLNMMIPTLPKEICSFSAIPVKIPMRFFAEIGKSILKFMWKLKGPEIDKTTLKKNKGGGLTLPDLKTYYKTVANKTVHHWYKDGFMTKRTNREP